VNRNLTISLNPGFLIWQVIFPLIYIFVAGFAYAPLIHGVPYGGKDLDYPAFLASGIIGGHCVIPNLSLIENENLNIIKKINELYEKFKK